MDHWALDQNMTDSSRRFGAALAVALIIHAVILSIFFTRQAPSRPPPKPIELTLDAPLAAKTEDATPMPAQHIGEKITTAALASAQGQQTETHSQLRPGQGITTTGNTGLTDTPATVPAPDTFNRLNEAVSRSLKTGYMTSRDRDGPAGAYLSEWKRQVERYGNANYPEELARHRLSGQLIMDVTIYKTGYILNIAIRQSSGSDQIDKAARRLVQLASPYPPFPAALAAQFDQIVITRTWQFSSGHELSTH